MIHIRETAVLDDKQKRVIFHIQPFTTGLDLDVTRGHTDPLGQLQTIVNFASQYKVHFPEFKPGKLYYDEGETPVEGTDYPWQHAHSRLLFLGVIINPPLACTVLEDYVRRTGERMIGKTMQPSPHITSDPIDFSAKVNGRPDINLVVRILTQAKNAGAGIKFIKPEPANGCVHCDLEKGVA